MSMAALFSSPSFAAKTGLFGPPARLAVGGLPVAVVIRDFNGDGHPDLATLNLSTGDISILLGTGKGKFGPATSFGTIFTSAFSFSSADLNGDGKLDLVAPAFNGFSEGVVSILLGDGNGSFSAVREFAIAGYSPSAVAIADFNGDGKLDLAVPAYNILNEGVVAILLGEGSESFSAATHFLVGTDPKSVAIGDFNHDGKLDLAVANAGSDNVSILLGRGDGSFNDATNFPVGSPGPASIAAGDFSGSGGLDLAVANSGNGLGNTVSILKGNLDGSFGLPTDFIVGSGLGNAQPYSVAVGDLNCDGKPDLAVANVNEGSVSVLVGTGHGSFHAALNFPVGNEGSGPVSVAIADLDGDGKLDLVTADFGEDFVSVLLNTIKKKCKARKTD